MKVYHPNFFDGFGIENKLERKLFTDTSKILYVRPEVDVVKLPKVSESIIGQPVVHIARTPKEDVSHIIIYIMLIILILVLLYIIYDFWKEEKKQEQKLLECQLAKKLVY